MSASAIAKNTEAVAGKGLDKPFCFIENKGQVRDQYNRPRMDVDYKLSTPGLNLYVGNGQLHYQFQKTEGTDAASAKISTYKMDVALVGADPHAKGVSSEGQQYFENYYLDGDKGYTVHSFNKVTYRNVYPNIDWVVYIKGEKVEYDFVVRPGGDANKIKIAYSGATKLSVASDGSLSAETPMGKITEHKPYSYETATGKEVASAFKLDGNVVSFETGKHNGALTIDPYLTWSSYYGGSAEDVAVSVRQSGAGQVYVGGYTASVGLGLGFGVFDATFNGGAYDAFISSINAATGVRLWSSYFGGSGIDQGRGVALDNAGAVYLVGRTNSTTGIASIGAHQAANNGLFDGFIFKLNTTNGARLWSTYFGGTEDDVVNGVITDGSNNVYVTGQTESNTDITTGGTYQPAISGTSDAFVAKFNAAGAQTWGTYYGGSAQESGTSIALDAALNVMITGQTNSVIGIATTGAYQTALSGTNDAFVAKISSAGTALTWGTYFGGGGSEEGRGLVCNAFSGEVAVVGNTNSPLFIANGFRAHQQVYGGGSQDAFLAYFTSTGSISWSTYYGGSGIDNGEGITLDQSRNIVIAGGTFSTNGISTPGSFQPVLGGSYDAYLAKFTNRGQRIWGTYFGNALYDYAYSVSCDAAGRLAIAGHTTSTTGISTAGVTQPAFAGGLSDGFVTKFATDTFILITQPYVDSLVCAGGSFAIPYTVNFNFQAGNVFTAQLSSASGSFASPVNIGTLASSISGSIPVTIPGGTVPGPGYRIRIVSSNPASISADNFVNIQVVTTLPPSTATGSTPVCVGSNIFLFDTAAYSITSYSWTGPAGSGFSSTLQNPVITGATTAHSGVYTVVTSHVGCPTVAATVTIVVNSFIPPTPTITASSLNCVGGTISLTANSGLGTTPVTYSWTGPAGFTSTLQSPTISPASLANGGYYYVVDTLDGCPSAKDSVLVTVTPTTPVSISITVSPNDTICSGTLVTFTASTVNGGVSPTFQWMTGTGPVVGAVFNTWSTATLTDGTDVYCILTSSATCPAPVPALSNVIKMNVINNPPIVFITASPGTSVPPGTPVTFTSIVYNGGTGPLYQWQSNGVDIPGATNSTFVSAGVAAFETIRVKVTSTMMCASPNFAFSNSLVIHPNTGIDDVSSDLGNIGLFPNPNSGIFTIKGAILNADIRNLSVEVMNAVGQVVYTDNIAVQNNAIETPVALGNMPNGVYLVRLHGEGQSRMMRFTIQR